MAHAEAQPSGDVSEYCEIVGALRSSAPVISAELSD